MPSRLKESGNLRCLGITKRERYNKPAEEDQGGPREDRGLQLRLRRLGFSLPEEGRRLIVSSHWPYCGPFGASSRL